MKCGALSLSHYPQEISYATYVNFLVQHPTF